MDSVSDIEDLEPVILTPPDITEEATRIAQNLLPAKSRKIYNATFENFQKWQKSNKAMSFSENVLLTYFNECAMSFKPPTLWSTFSMLKTVLACQHNIDISQYHKLTAFLKQRLVGYASKKSKVFTSEQISRFLSDAPDESYLPIKVACVLGISGACRREEFTNLSISNIETQGNILLVNLPDTKTHVPRSFAVTNEFKRIVDKYLALRPPKSKLSHTRFFVNYQKGKCTSQPIGINKIGAYPKLIAQFLDLPEPELYTGHSFRRSSATLLADNGANITTLKRHGGWKSTTVAEKYIEDSISNKTKIQSMITENISTRTSNSTLPDSNPATTASLNCSTTILANHSTATTAPTMSQISMPNCSTTTTTPTTSQISTTKKGMFFFQNCNVTIHNYVKQ